MQPQSSNVQRRTLCAKTYRFVDAALKQAVICVCHSHQALPLHALGVLTAGCAAFALLLSLTIACQVTIRRRKLCEELFFPCYMLREQQERDAPERCGRDVGQAGPEQRQQHRRSLLRWHLHAWHLDLPVGNRQKCMPVHRSSLTQLLVYRVQEAHNSGYMVSAC